MVAAISGFLSSPFLAASWATISWVTRASLMDSRNWGVSGCPWATRPLSAASIRDCGIETPLTFAPPEPDCPCAATDMTSPAASNAYGMSFIGFPLGWCSNFARRVGLDGERVDFLFHQRAERLVHHAVALLRRLAVEFARDDDELVVAAAALRALVADVRAGLVENL